MTKVTGRFQQQPFKYGVITAQGDISGFGMESSITPQKGTNFERTKLLQDVRDFHTKFGFRDTWAPTNHNLNQRADMMQEEVDEFKEAVSKEDYVGTIDAIVDLLYFALGTADLMGFNFDAHWQAVQDSNMEKQRGTKSTRPDSGGFDCIKPEGFIPPENRHREILTEYPGLRTDLWAS